MLLTSPCSACSRYMCLLHATQPGTLQAVRHVIRHDESRYTARLDAVILLGISELRDWFLTSRLCEAFHCLLDSAFRMLRDRKSYTYAASRHQSRHSGHRWELHTVLFDPLERRTLESAKPCVVMSSTEFRLQFNQSNPEEDKLKMIKIRCTVWDVRT